MLDGWELTPVFTARSGAPYSIYDLANQNPNNFYVYSRLVLDQTMPATTRVATGTPDQYTVYNFGTINTGSFLNPKTGDSDFGPFPNNMTGRNAFRAPGTWNLDLGMYKGIKFGERTMLQLRLEAFNAFNHANFVINTGSAYLQNGAITGTYGPTSPGCGCTGSRNVQLGAKLVF